MTAAALRKRNAAIAIVIGVTVARLAIGGHHRNYVRAAMGPWLVVSGLILVAAGLVTVLAGPGRAGVRPLGQPPANHDRTDDHNHDHDPGPQSRGDTNADEHTHGSRVGWLLLAPVLVLFAVGPSPLGSFAADRSLSSAPRLSARRPYPPLQTDADGVVRMTLTEYIERGAFDTSKSLETKVVELEGFVMPDDKGPYDFLLTRFQVACCAADGQATQIRIVGLAIPSPPRDAWVRVSGRLVPADAATMRVESITRIPVPDDPYEEA